MSQKNSLIAVETKHPHIATIIFDHPEKHNALNPQMISELLQAYRACENNTDVHIIILKANGKHFCAGADLSHMLKMSEASFENNYQDAKELAALFHFIYRCKKPTIACAHGSVRGGGIGLLAAHDIVIAENNASFAFTEVKLGLAPAMIAPFILQRIDFSTAKLLMLTAEVFSAERAREIKLIDHLCDMAALETKAQTVAETLLKNDLNAQENTKKWLQQLRPIAQKQLDEAAQLLATLRSSENARRLLKGFLTRST